uniref:Major facilitator superfamily (MFS) profile domain-containing protein n=1 Tax=Oryza brachyantha TaxID=4533 RepID=J3L695_ORYBR
MADHRSKLLPPLLESAMADTVAGAVDYRGRLASRASTGGWKSSAFVMAMEIAERFAYKGVAANLITYLTGPLGQPMAGAAASIDAWKGVSQMLPLPLACVADGWLGRYRAIVLASVIFILSMGTLSMSSAFPVSRSGHVAVFYVALYMVALGEGAHKPCAQAFAADQFDEKDPKECVARSSFFNWWYFGMCAGTAVTTMVSSYVQDNVGWGVGFGIPCIVIVVSLTVFLLGTRSYRFYTTKAASPVSRVGKAFLTLIRSWRSNRRTNPASGGKRDGDGDGGDLVEEVKSVFRLLPIWASCIIYAIIFSQTSTFFTKQAATLDRRIGRSFKVPPAALQTFISVSIVAFIPVYDRLFVPLARRGTAAVHGEAVGHHHAAEGGRRARALPRRRHPVRPRGDEAPPRRRRRRPGGQPQGAAPDGPVVDGPAVRAHRRRRRVRHGRPAGVLLRPGPRRRAQPRPRAVPQHLRRRPPPQQPPHLGDRQGDGEARGQLVRQQPQPRAPRLLLLAPRRPLRRGARRLLAPLAGVRLQEEGRRRCRVQR